MRTQARRCLALSLVLFASLAVCQVAHAATRSTVCYTAWDDYYFYAAFQVDDPRVNSTNTTPLSQPQQDDDIEVFFDTKGAQASSARTPGTYQMAVSAGSGAYFSTGDTTGKPKAKLVFTYKYAATVDGTLNRNTDTDVGYTIEMAIPWKELGQAGPPSPGTVWGFNVINRDRETTATPANRLASLSAGVKGAADVQDPKAWTKITFTDSLVSLHSGPGGIYCPHVQGHFPIIDGVVRSGEWFRGDGFSLGAPVIAAAAPTPAQEPNVDISASEAFQQAVDQTPPPTVVNPGSAPPDNGTAELPAAAPVTAPAPATTPPPVSATPTGQTPEYDIQLPGGGTVHVGKRRPPPPTQTPTVQSEMPAYQPPQKGKRGRNNKIATNSGGPYGPQFPAVGPNLDQGQALRMLDQPRVSPLFLALYKPSFSAGVQGLGGSSNGTDNQFRMDQWTNYVDQPISGAGSWFGGGSVQYHMDQLKDARRAGVDVLLIEYVPSDIDSRSAIITLVQALQELRASGDDYPLLGLSLHAPYIDAYSAIHDFFQLVPPEFRGEVILPDAQDNRPDYIAVVHDATNSVSLQTRFARDFAGEGAGLFVGEIDSNGVVSAVDGVTLATSLVTPVANPAKLASNRDQGASYNASWGAADSAAADWALLDSWNDYARGTDVTATRQYGEHYADLTKLYSLQWNGGQEWHARYLKSNVPAVMSPNTLYTVQVRVENAGSLPWRLGEDYGLSYRWYKDGRLYDDSAPKLPVNTDIYPGQSMTLSVGILPHNQYGSPIEPGDYTLVFDMVQGTDRWFTLAGDIGLKVHVHVADANESIPAKASFLDSTLPTRVKAGATYTAVVTVRNDGSAIWKAGQTRIEYVATPGYSANTTSLTGGTAIASDVQPGAVAQLKVPVTISGVSGQQWQIKWTVHNPDATGHLIQSVSTVGADDGASFILNDVPRNLKTGQQSSARLGIVNLGNATWSTGKWQVGYHWAYLDGTAAPGPAGVLTPINGDVAPNVATAVTAKFKAPDYPGRYFLVWDVRDPEGAWSSELGQKMHPYASLPVMVTVTEGGNAQAKTIDLGKYYNVTAAGFEGQAAGDFDGNGFTMPGDQLPPDGTNDTVSNPVLTAKPGPAYYPSGFYAGAGAADHKIAFYFPNDKSASNAVTCSGQRIALPEGYSSIHLLAAATGDTPETASFTVDGNTQSVTVAPWSTAPSGNAVALRIPYRLHQGTVDSAAPAILGDYTIDTPNGARSITLPNDPNIKVLAITVAR